MKWAVRIIAALLMLCAIMWVGDYARLRYLVAHHRGTSIVVVTEVDTVHLKNGKTEFYGGEPQDQACVESLFPHMGIPACWKLRRNASQQNDYFKSPSKY